MHLMHFKSAPSQPLLLTAECVLCSVAAPPCLPESPALAWFAPVSADPRSNVLALHLPLISGDICLPKLAKAATVSLSTNCSRSLTYQMSVSLCSSALSRSRRIDSRERRKGVAFHCTTRSWLVRMCVCVHIQYIYCMCGSSSPPHTCKALEDHHSHKNWVVFTGPT